MAERKEADAGARPLRTDEEVVAGAIHEFERDHVEGLQQEPCQPLVSADLHEVMSKAKLEGVAQAYRGLHDSALAADRHQNGGQWRVGLLWKVECHQCDVEYKGESTAFWAEHVRSIPHLWRASQGFWQEYGEYCEAMHVANCPAMLALSLLEYEHAHGFEAYWVVLAFRKFGLVGVSYIASRGEDLKVELAKAEAAEESLKLLKETGNVEEQARLRRNLDLQSAPDGPTLRRMQDAALEEKQYLMLAWAAI